MVSVRNYTVYLFVAVAHSGSPLLLVGFMSEANNHTEGTLPAAPQDNLGAYTLQSGDTYRASPYKSTVIQVYGTSSPTPTA